MIEHVCCSMSYLHLVDQCTCTCIYIYKVNAMDYLFLLEIRGEVHYMSLVGDRSLLVLDRNKLPLPPLYNRYFMWGFPDRSARVAFVEADKVREGGSV